MITGANQMIVNADQAVDLALDMGLRQHEPERALEMVLRAVRAEPDNERAVGVCATLLHLCDRNEETIKMATLATVITKDHKMNAAARWTRGLAQLCLGDYRRGFHDYQYGIAAGIRTGFKSSAPPWRGGPVNGRLMITATEQGYGDAIMFARFLGRAKQTSEAQIILHCDEVLYPLLRDRVPYDVIATDGATEHDYQAALPSLPYLLGVSVEDITGEPYLPFYRTQGPGVGICWHGNPLMDNDYWRSTILDQWTPVLELIERPVSLQYGEQETARQFGMETPPIDNLEDTAKTIAGLDLVITTDTVIQHLAGAIGKECWLLVSTPIDWRWRRPWYDSVRIFQQERRGEWGPVFERVAEALRARYEP